MPEGPGNVRVLATKHDVAGAAADLFVEEAQRAIGECGLFSVALAGGTTFEAAYRLLASPPRRDVIDWTRVAVFFGDERCVPEGHPDRNDRAAREALLHHVPLLPENIHPIDASTQGAAPRYESEIRTALGVPIGAFPRLDLVLLGMGPDGHTASLFPGHDALRITERLVARIAGSPKPPPERVTFTLPLLNASRCVLFVVTGAEKREAAAKALRGDGSVPAGLVRPADGRLLWLLDRAAAASDEAEPR